MRYQKHFDSCCTWVHTSLPSAYGLTCTLDSPACRCLAGLHARYGRHHDAEKAASRACTHGHALAVILQDHRARTFRESSMIALRYVQGNCVYVQGTCVYTSATRWLAATEIQWARCASAGTLRPCACDAPLRYGRPRLPPLRTRTNDVRTMPCTVGRRCRMK